MNSPSDSRPPRRTECALPAKKRLTPAQVRGRHHAAEAYGKARRALHAAGNDECAADRVRQHYGFSSKSIIGDWSTPDSGIAITVGDLIAGPRALAVEVLRTLLEQLDASAPTRVATDPRDEVLRLASRIGTASNKAREVVENDGRVDAGEWGEMECEAASIERDARAMRRACAAAREMERSK